MKDHVHYMKWMGHLPMLAHPDPKDTLVICFGTGQTANAVRHENPDTLDIVDINENVFKFADYFPPNEGVLNDERVNAIVMDGRSYLRRNPKLYDVITLEPMPPNFAGVNALYSREFYELAKNRMTEDGTIAQWVPFHLITPHTFASLMKTFQDVFPNSLLWLDPPSGTAILLGSKNDSYPLGQKWPGYNRQGNRDLSIREVREAVILDKDAMRKEAESGEIITDDNQLLAYGSGTRQIRDRNIRGQHKILEGRE
jgi:spermidine synthase